LPKPRNAIWAIFHQKIVVYRKTVCFFQPFFEAINNIPLKVKQQPERDYVNETSKKRSTGVGNEKGLILFVPV
jgi:hypothetical protein